MSMKSSRMLTAIVMSASVLLLTSACMRAAEPSPSANPEPSVEAPATSEPSIAPEAGGGISGLSEGVQANTEGWSLMETVVMSEDIAGEKFSSMDANIANNTGETAPLTSFLIRGVDSTGKPVELIGTATNVQNGQTVSVNLRGEGEFKTFGSFEIIKD